MPSPPTDAPDLGPEGAPGRHGRARTLARRRSEGEQLTSYEDRLLSAHVSACERCRDWVDALPAPAAAASPAPDPQPVPSGQEHPARDTVGVVDASGGTGHGDARKEGPGDEEPAHSDAVTPGPEGKKDREGELDAMGRPKRRAVVGEGYGPSKGRQLALYVVAVAAIIGVYFGAAFAVGKLDTAPDHEKAQAPWAQDGVPQRASQRFQ